VEILGVMRPDFQYPSREFELWTPLYYPLDALKARQDLSYTAVGRLRAGVTIQQAQAQMDVVAADLGRDYPATNADMGVYVDPMLGAITESVRPTLWLLLAAVGMLYLVGCVNLAELLLARATGRQREFAIRWSLGATRMKLARQSFAETVPIALAGAALGVIGASWLLALLVPLLPATTPRLEEIGIHGPVLIFVTLLSMATALAISAAPAVHVSTTLVRGPSRHGRLSDVLIAAEIASTVVLLVGAGLLIRSFVQVRATDPGFEPSRSLALHFAVDRAVHGNEDRDVARYLARMMDRSENRARCSIRRDREQAPLGGQTQTPWDNV
jgi:hypothetical protein